MGAVASVSAIETLAKWDATIVAITTWASQKYLFFTQNTKHRPIFAFLIVKIIKRG